MRNKSTINVVLAHTLAAMLLFASGTVTMSAQYYMNIRQADGTTYRYAVSQVDSVWFDEANYEYVDLGLSVKWATCNVGATKPEEYGDYFAWGETEPKTDYSWSTYRWCKGSSDTQTKYCTNSRYGYNGFTDYKTVLDMADDVAHVKWGGSWRMPTIEEIQELLDNCTWIWTTQNGVNGYKVTSNIPGYTDRSIFLPAAGWRYGTSHADAGEGGYCWASSVYAGYYALGLYFGSGSVERNRTHRSVGQSVRPVCPSETWADDISITLDKDSYSLEVGESLVIHATLRKGNDEIYYPITSWISDAPEIVSVTAAGLVTAIAEGSAKITASILDKSVTCTIEVIPLQHPLAFILGELRASGESYFNGPEEWTVTFSKDPDGDLNKVWIKNFVNGGSSASSPIYGVVNEEKNLISIPVGQTIALSSSYSSITLEGFRGEEGEENIAEGDNIYGTISADGTIVIQDWFGSNIEGGKGWYNVFYAGVTLRRNSNVFDR